MIYMIASEIFGFNWGRLKNPLVITGIVIMIVGMILLISAKPLNAFILDKASKRDKIIKDKTLMFKAISGILVLIGAIIAVATA